jgi:hypothetical protein
MQLAQRSRRGVLLPQARTVIRRNWVIQLLAFRVASSPSLVSSRPLADRTPITFAAPN